MLPHWAQLNAGSHVYKRGAKQGQISEVGQPLTQGLEFKADQEHVCQCKEACLIYDGRKQRPTVAFS